MATTPDELNRLIQQWENAQVEFKRELSGDVLHDLTTDFAAMANAQGGRIVFGVDENKNPIGCELKGDERNRISQEASKCRPPIMVDFEEVPFGAKRFLVVRIPKSDVLHSDHERKFPIRLGSITEYLDGVTLQALLQQRSSPPAGFVLTSSTVDLGMSTTERKRDTLRDEEVDLMTELFESDDSAVRVEALRDLAYAAHNREFLTREALSSAIRRSLGGRGEERMLALDTLRSASVWGTDAETRIAKGFASQLIEIAKDISTPDSASRAFSTLVYQSDRAVVDILVHWIMKAGDKEYNAITPSNLVQDFRSFGLDHRTKEALYGLLKKGVDEKTQKRIGDVLVRLRY